AGFIGRSNFLDGTPDQDGKTFITRSGLTITCDMIDARADTLLVRPESIAVRREADAGANRFKARIAAVIFQGSSFDLDLRLASGEVIAAEVAAPAGGHSNDWAAGEEVTVVIDPAVAVGSVGRKA